MKTKKEVIAIVDERMPEEQRERLCEEGFRVLAAKRSGALPEAMAAHPDMLLFYHERTLISAKSYRAEAPELFAEIERLAPEVELRFTEEAPLSAYPRDCIFNALAMGGKLFAKADSAARSIMEYAREHELELVNVKQGYPACTVLPVTEGLAITADRGMARALEAHGIEAELIENGGIALPPYEYGFIGGAAGRYGDRIYFAGDIATHPCGARIAEICRGAGREPVALAASELLDLGRIIFIEGGGQENA